MDKLKDENINFGCAVKFRGNGNNTEAGDKNKTAPYKNVNTVKFNKIVCRGCIKMKKFDTASIF